MIETRGLDGPPCQERAGLDQGYDLPPCQRYRVDGLVVVTNVDPVFLAGLPSGGRPFLERLARAHGRRLPAGEREATA